MIAGVGQQPAAIPIRTPDIPQRVELATPASGSSGSGALPEAASAFDIALQIQDVQVQNLKRAIDSQAIILDLLA